MIENMRILQFAPLDYQVKENALGGTELFIYLLDKYLTLSQHQSIVMAGKDSKLFGNSSAERLIAGFSDLAEYMTSGEFNNQFFHVTQVAREIEAMQKLDYDIIHCNATKTMKYSQFAKAPVVHTLHFPVEWFWDTAVFGEINKTNNYFVSVSQAQKRNYESKGIQVDEVIYNGVSTEDFQPNFSQGNYLLFLGRVSPTKSPHLALQVAKQTGMDLVIAGGPRSPEQLSYYKSEIEPFVTHDVSQKEEKLPAIKEIKSKSQKIIFTGLVDKQQKTTLLQHAKAVLFTTEIPESCPYVIMEAMACGKPVIGLARGGVPEIIEDRKTGFLADSVDDMRRAVYKLGEISGEYCRESVEKRFSMNRVIAQYLDLYQRLVR